MAVLLGLTLPAAAQKDWTSGYSGITHKGYYAYWLYAVKSQTKKNNAKRFFKTAFFGLGTAKKFGPAANYEPQEKVSTEVTTYQNERLRAFKTEADKHQYKDSILKTRVYLQESLKDNDIFEDYQIYPYDADMFSPLNMSAARLAFLKLFFTSPTAQAKRSEELTPFKAELRDNGIILYGFKGNLYLLINPKFKTVEVCSGSHNLKNIEELNSPVKENLLED